MHLLYRFLSSKTRLAFQAGDSLMGSSSIATSHVTAGVLIISVSVAAYYMMFCCGNRDPLHDDWSDDGDEDVPVIGKGDRYPYFDALARSIEPFVSSTAFIADFARLAGRLSVLDADGVEHRFDGPPMNGESIDDDDEFTWRRVYNVLELAASWFASVKGGSSQVDSKFLSALREVGDSGIKRGAEPIALRSLLTPFLVAKERGEDDRDDSPLYVHDMREPRIIHMIRCIHQSIVFPSASKVATLTRVSSAPGLHLADIEGILGWTVKVRLFTGGKFIVEHEKRSGTSLAKNDPSYFKIGWCLELECDAVSDDQSAALTAARLQITHLEPGKRMRSHAHRSLLRKCAPAKVVQ